MHVVRYKEIPDQFVASLLKLLGLELDGVPTLSRENVLHVLLLYFRANGNLNTSERKGEKRMRRAPIHTGRLNMNIADTK